MDATIAYDTVVGLLANPPSLGSRPNFFNLRELRLHYARALKKVPCPQSAINGWSGAVLAPAMYTLIDTSRFHWNISAPPIPEFPARFVQNDDGTDGAEIPYTREEIFTITATQTAWGVFKAPVAVTNTISVSNGTPQFSGLALPGSSYRADDAPFNVTAATSSNSSGAVTYSRKMNSSDQVTDSRASRTEGVV